VTGSFSPRTAFLAFLAGTFLAQLAWIISMPAFAGIDEFDHVYKAAAVARGSVQPVGHAPHGRGELVAVPADIVTAAGPVCSSLPYTERDNCFAVDRLGDGRVTVASGAARYNPAYYAIVGTVARPFHGEAVVYAMRITTALLCALMVAWAAAVLTTWSRSRWPLLGLLVATTPVLVYSTAMASPNGISYAAGLLAWAALLGLVRYDVPERPTLLLTAFGTASAALLLTHTTGPLWLALIVLVGFCLRTPRQWWLLVRTQTRAMVTTAVVVVACTLLSVAWTTLSGANSLGADTPSEVPLRAGSLVGSELLWVLQSIAAFPLRNEHAPIIVYTIWLVPMMVALGLAVLKGRRRDRVATGLLVVLAFAVPTVLTVVSYRYVGFAWQGRYGLPLTVGLFLIAGWVLDQRRVPAGGRVVIALFALTTTATIISVVGVALQEIHRGVTSSVADSVPGGVVLVIALSVLGLLVPVLVLLRPERLPETSADADLVLVSGSVR
jgi:Predicted membrane protein (DUF2142)